MASGGLTYDNLRPHTPDGGNYDPDSGEVTYGCYVAHYSWANLRNPRPGFIYSYVLNKPTEFYRVEGDGWERVQNDEGDTEQLGQWFDQRYGAEKEGVKGYGEWVLYRIPEERYADLMAAAQRMNDWANNAAGDTYLTAGEGREAAYAQQAGVSSLRYARRDHGNTTDELPIETPPRGR